MLCVPGLAASIAGSPLVALLRAQCRYAANPLEHRACCAALALLRTARAAGCAPAGHGVDRVTMLQLRHELDLAVRDSMALASAWPAADPVERLGACPCG